MDSIASNTTIISEGAPVPHENSLPRKPRADSDPTTGIFGIIMWASGLAAFGVQGAHLPPFRRKKPENDQERTATIRIWAGETAPGQSPYGLTNASLPGDDNLEGLMPSVRLRSNYGVKLCDTKQGDAKKREDYIHEGRTVSIDCVLDDNVQGQPRYLDVAGAVTNKDTSLCIALIEVQTAAKHLTWTWSGDVGYYCGYPWYHSNVIVSREPTPYRPYCTWLSSDLNVRGMSIYLPGFESITSSNKKGNLSALAAQLQRDPKRLCNSPARFAMWNTFSIEKNYRAPYYNPFMDINETDGVEIWEGRRSPELDFKWTEYGEGTLEPPRPQARANQSAWPNVPEKRKPHQARDIASRFDIDPIHKRMMQEAHRKFEGKLVKASATWQRHSGAIDLCSSVSSSGPDFVDEREGMFCDMKHKKMWPVCKADDESACFDLKVNVLRKGQRGDHFGTDETGVLSPASLRSYRVVETWD